MQTKNDLFFNYFSLFCSKILMLKIMNVNKPESNETNQYLFLYFCKYGETVILDHLLTTRKVSIYETTVRHAFREACLQNRLEIAKWLHLHFIIDFSENITSKLLFALCEREHLSVLMWLFCHFALDVLSLEKEKSILLLACTHGNIELAKYILSILVAQGVNPHMYIEKTVSQETFQKLCDANSLRMVKWLYSLHYGYLHKNKTYGKEAFIYACKNRNNKMAHWLLGVFMNDFDHYPWDNLFSS